MLPEEKVGEAGTSIAEPVTPEFILPNGNELNFAHMLPTAPKGKPRAPPLIHTKVKPNEAGIFQLDDNPVSNGSKIPLLKTKYSDKNEFLESHYQGKRHNTNYELHKREKSPKSTLPGFYIQKTVEKVKVSKGIEMQRVKSKGFQTKGQRQNPTVSSKSVNGCKSLGIEKNQPSHQQTGGETRKKMIKVEATFFSDVKLPTVPKQNIQHKPKNTTSKDVKVNSGASTTTGPDTTPAVESSMTYTTIDEFLQMPKTSLPEQNLVPNQKKQKMFKSKFWEYIDPSSKSSKSPSKSKSPKKSYYDPEGLKTYIQKQKELRKRQCLQESEKRQKENEKRQKMLKELDSKCQRIVIATKTKPSSISEESPAVYTTPNQETKKRRIDSESPNMKYMKPLLERRQGALLKKSETHKSDAAKQAQYLLSEFENIVKRECISFLQKMPTSTTQPNVKQKFNVEKVDKAVGTSFLASEKETKTTSSLSLEVSDSPSSSFTPVPSSSTVQKAATKIQACFRAYRIRKGLKNVKLLSRARNRAQQPAVLDQSSNKRRWSFPKLPEKPYENLHFGSKLLPMSPLPTAFTSDSSVFGYIPPPPPSLQSHSSRNLSKPKVLPSFPITPVRLRVYDEPYPKRTTSLGGSSDDINGNNIVDSGTSHEEIEPKPNSLENQRHKTRASLPMNFSCLSHHGLRATESTTNLVIPTPLPSIIDALREKVRHFGNTYPAKPSDSNVQFDSILASKPPSKSPATYESDFECSDNTSTTTKNSEIENVEKTCKSEDTTPKIRKHKHRSRGRTRIHQPASTSSKYDSTTTVDTDVELLPKSKSTTTIESSNVEKSSEVDSETMCDTTSNSNGDVFAPALALQFAAEREHLQIIEKALRIKLLNRTPERAPQVEKESLAASTRQVNNKTTSVDETFHEKSTEAHRLQLAIANCNKESMKAAAEMAKWMAEFRKTTVEQDKARAHQTSVDMAAVVYAAVEQARQIGEDKRREREKKHRKLLAAVTSKPVDEVKNDTDILDTEFESPESSSKLGDQLLETKTNETEEEDTLERKQESVSNKSESLVTSKPVEDEYDVIDDFESTMSSSKHDNDDQLMEKISSETEEKPKQESISEKSQSLVTSKPDDEADEILDEIEFPESVSKHGEQSLEVTNHEIEEEEEHIKEPSLESISEISQLQSMVTSKLDDEVDDEVDKLEDDVDEVDNEVIDEVDCEVNDQMDNELDDILDEFDFPESSSKHDEKSVEMISKQMEEEYQQESISDKSLLQSLLISKPDDELDNDVIDEDIIDEFESTENSLKHDEESVDKTNNNEEEGVLESKEESILDKSQLESTVASKPDDEIDEDEIEFPESVLKQDDEELLEKTNNETAEEEEHEQSLESSLKSKHDEQLVEKISKETEDDNKPEPISNKSDQLESLVTSKPDIDDEVDEILEEIEFSETSTKSKGDEKLVEMISNETEEEHKDKSISDKSQLEPSVTAKLVDDVDEILDEFESPESSSKHDDQLVEKISNETEEELKEESISDKSQLELASLVTSKPDDEGEDILDDFESPESSSKHDEQLLGKSNNETEVEQKLEPKQDPVPDKPQYVEMESEIPLKPPPPYSPPSSLDSTSLSSRSVMVALQKDKLMQIITYQVDLMWEAWNGIGSFPDIQSVLNTTDINIAKRKDTENGGVMTGKNADAANSAVQSVDGLVAHLVYDTIKDVLQIENSLTPYIERVRPGPLSLQAQKLRIPKTKEILVTTVYNIVMKSIPPTFFPDSQPVQGDKCRLRKWCSRPRELVDEVLLEELVEEDYQWTEWWPEEVIVLHQVSEKIIKSLVHNTLKKRAYVLKH